MHIPNISPFDTAHAQLVSMVTALASLHEEEMSRWAKFENAREQVAITQHKLSEIYIASHEGAATNDALREALKATARAGLVLTSALVSLHEISTQCIDANKQLEDARSTYMNKFGNGALPHIN